MLFRMRHPRVHVMCLTVDSSQLFGVHHLVCGKASILSLRNPPSCLAGRGRSSLPLSAVRASLGACGSFLHSQRIHYNGKNCSSPKLNHSGAPTKDFPYSSIYPSIAMLQFQELGGNENNFHTVLSNHFYISKTSRCT
jgi:hypothetical protein